jgi:hypothetical protein
MQGLICVQVFVDSFALQSSLFNPVGSGHSAELSLDRIREGTGLSSAQLYRSSRSFGGKMVGDRIAQSCAKNGLLASVFVQVRIENTMWFPPFVDASQNDCECRLPMIYSLTSP